MPNLRPTYISGSGVVDAESMRGKMDVVSKTADYTILEGDSNVIFLSAKTSGSHTFTLPSALTAGLLNRNGLVYTFVLANVNTQLLVTPAGSDKIVMKVSEGGASLAPAGGTGVKNTTATHVLGDRVTLVSNGVDTWFGIEQSGTWASQP
jgi:hypothetical protein